jgi:hypothetical protein
MENVLSYKYCYMSIQSSLALITKEPTERNFTHINRNMDVSSEAETHHLFYISLVPPAYVFQCWNNWHPIICHRTMWTTFTLTHSTLYSILHLNYFNNILPSSNMATYHEFVQKKIPHIPVILSPLDSITPIIANQKFQLWSSLLCHFVYFLGPYILLHTSFPQPSIFVAPSEVKFNTIIKQNKLTNSSFKRDEMIHKMYELNSSKIIQMQYPFKFITNMTLICQSSSYEPEHCHIFKHLLAVLTTLFYTYFQTNFLTGCYQFLFFTGFMFLLKRLS